MAKKRGKKSRFGAAFRTVNLARRFNWPRGKMRGKWLKDLAE